MRRFIIIIAVLAISACDGMTPLPVASGPWTHLNADQWSPTQADMEYLPR